MDFALTLYVVFCCAIGLMGLETIDYKRWRWSIAGMLKLILVVSVMLALGRLVALA
jgi:hypothetical protein